MALVLCNTEGVFQLTIVGDYDAGLKIDSFDEVRVVAPSSLAQHPTSLSSNQAMCSRAASRLRYRTNSRARWNG